MEKRKTKTNQADLVIFKHIPAFLGIFRYIHAYSDLIRYVQKLFRHIKVHLEPCITWYSQSPGIFRKLAYSEPVAYMFFYKKIILFP